MSKGDIALRALYFLRPILSLGHQIQEVPEFPLVVSDKIQEYNKTKQAVQFLRKIKAWNDIERVYKSKHFRAGKGKMRNRRRVQRLGPVLVYANDSGVTKAFRNIPGNFWLFTTISTNRKNRCRNVERGKIEFVAFGPRRTSRSVRHLD